MEFIKFKVSGFLKWLENKEALLLLIIFFIGFAFRFYNAPLRYSFNDDSIRDALVAIGGARQFQIPLTGPFSSLGPFTFGPWYYYQLIAFSIISKLEYAPWIYQSILSTLLVIVMYKIGDLLYGKKFGLLLSFLVAISPSQIGSSTVLSNPNFVPFYAGLSFMFFLKILQSKKTTLLSLFFGLALGIGINHHYQMAGLMILPLLFILKYPRRIREFIICIFGIFLTFIPLLVFDLNNHWFTVRNMFYFYTEGRKMIYVPNRWLFYLRDFWPNYWSYSLGVPELFGLTSIFFTLLILTFAFLKKKISSSLGIILIVFFINFILLRYYWGERGYQYLQFLFPILYIAVAFSIYYLLKLKLYKYFGVGFLLLLVFFMTIKNVADIKIDGDQVEFIREKNLIRSSYNNQKINFYTCKSAFLKRARSMPLLLENDNISSDNGKTIAYREGDCKMPKNLSILGKAKDATEEAKLLEEFYPYDKISNTLDFSQSSSSSLLESGWIKTTPKKVYDETTRWWYDEKP